MAETLVVIAGALAGAVASITGFGVGSLLTPLLAAQMDTRLAVAVVSVPHVAGTLLRFWMLRQYVERRVFWTFGLTSAGGGLAGALLHGASPSRALTLLFGALLLFVAVAEVTGLSRRLVFRGAAGWAAGAASGVLGGLVGNQGGIRSAALLGFTLSKEQFVATATAIALLIDAARVPVYLVTVGDQMAMGWPTIALASGGVVVGTLAGAPLLRRIPERGFRRILAVTLAALGLAMLVRGIGEQ